MNDVTLMRCGYRLGAIVMQRDAVERGVLPKRCEKIALAPSPLNKSKKDTLTNFKRCQENT